MQVIVLADEAGREELMTKEFPNNVQLTFAENLPAVIKEKAADVFFILKEGLVVEDPAAFQGKPVFINSTLDTLEDLTLPGNFIRINGWPTFLKRQVWEVSTKNELVVKNTFEKLAWQYIIVADEPGLVSARIISMIVNEAYFALGEDVSSKEEIDLAMKLGTNYPHGPFEWSKKIGLRRINNLLQKLTETGSRYAIAPALKNELEDI
jgi:3-hydroxybutyryl-CoA dehydrogenase